MTETKLDITQLIEMLLSRDIKDARLAADIINDQGMLSEFQKLYPIFQYKLLKEFGGKWRETYLSRFYAARRDVPDRPRLIIDNHSYIYWDDRPNILK